MKSKLFIKDWLSMKPYTVHQSSDIFYLQVANQVKSQIVRHTQNFDFKSIFEHPEIFINELSCFLTSYLEDIVSGTRLWETFQKVYKERYQKELPLISIGDDYYEGEVNPEDLNFLIWYYVNASQDVIVFGHNESWIVQLSHSLASILQNAWETAPENKQLQSYYELEAGKHPFFDIRKLIEKLLLQSYLFYPDVKVDFLKSIRSVADKYKGDQLTMVIWNQQTFTYHNLPTRLMALFGNEWVAAYLGSSHPLYKATKEMSKKVSGAFLYNSEDEETYNFEHLASGRSFKVAKASFDNLIIGEDKVFYIDLVSWNGLWWMSGLMYQLNMNETQMEAERNDINKAYILEALIDEQWTKPGLKQELSIFNNLTKGSSVAFHKKDTLIPFLTALKEAVLNESGLENAALSAERIDKAIHNFVLNTNMKEDVITVYFDEIVGLEFAYGIQEAFQFPQNPYYNEERSSTVFLEMITQATISPQLVHYYILNNKEVVAQFNEMIHDVWIDNLDFLCRYWKHNTYFLKAV